MKDELKLSRKLLSGYYVSILIASSVLQIPFIKDFVLNLRTALSSIIYQAANVQLESTSQLWWSLFIVCLLLLMVLRKTIVDQLGFYVSEEGKNSNAIYGVMVFLVLGSFIYMINKVFDYAMPNSIPDFLVTILDGFKEPLDTTAYTISENNIRSTIAPIIWNVGPIACFWYLHLSSKSGGGSSGD